MTRHLCTCNCLAKLAISQWWLCLWYFCICDKTWVLSLREPGFNKNTVGIFCTVVIGQFCGELPTRERSWSCAFCQLAFCTIGHLALKIQRAAHGSMHSLSYKPALYKLQYCIMHIIWLKKKTTLPKGFYDYFVNFMIIIQDWTRFPRQRWAKNRRASLSGDKRPKPETNHLPLRPGASFAIFYNPHLQRSFKNTISRCNFHSQTLGRLG